MKKITPLVLAFMIINVNAFAQFLKFSPTSDTTAKISLEGYVDTYFCYDFAEPEDGNIPYFVSQNRHSEVNINLAYLSIKYSSQRVRATFSPGFGTYINSNYAAERTTLQNIVEANAGVKLCRNKDIWVDVGVIGSPFTNETSISFDQPTLTRSFAPEYVPYYLTGARLTLPVGKKFTVFLYLVNGWQVIEDPNIPLAFAGQFEYKPTEKLTLNLNTFYGDERSANSPNNRKRAFLDFYTIYKPGKFSFTLSSYVGNQKRLDIYDDETNNAWWQVNGTVKYAFTDVHSVTARGEYFDDPKSVMISPVTGIEGFTCAAFSLGYNMAITPAVLFRVEGRYFQASDDVFLDKDANVNSHGMVTGGLTAKF